MKNKARAILLNDTENWYHWGCHLTSRALKQLIGKHYELAINVPIYDLHRIPQSPTCLDDFNDPEFLQYFAGANAGLLDQLNQVDHVFINGEGSIHGASALALNLLYIALLAKLALNKSVYIVNHSTYPNDSDQALGNDLDNLYTDIYQIVDYVAIREARSHRLVQKLGVDAAELSFDCSVLALQTDASPRQKVIALGGSVAFEKPGLEQLLKVLQPYACSGYEICFLYGAPANTAADDLEFAAFLNSQNLCPVNPVYCDSADQFIGQIKRSAVMVSGRFHYSIIAHALGTPVVVLGSNTPKNEALQDLTGIAAPLPWSHECLAAKANILIQQALAAKDFPASASAQLETLQGRAHRNLPQEIAEERTSNAPGSIPARETIAT